MNKVVFLNIDGTKTMYTFDYPVKYIDESGKIKDITLEIADSETAAAGFVTEANNAVTTFSNHLSDGISLSGNGVEINLVPALPKTNVSMEGMSAKASVNAQSSYTAKRIDEKTIEYPYDANTTIEYSLTYTGFKEDIVVTEYTGQTEYEFTLYTNGYSLSQINGAYYLTDQQGNIKASIGDVIIFTADQRNNTYGYIAPKTIVENEEYLLTIVVDEAFLKDEKTVYPIRIDPTVEINYGSNGSGAIEDVTVYSGAASNGTQGSLYVGDCGSQGIGRVLMKFPGLDLNTLGSAVEIQTATLTVRDLMCESAELPITACIFAGNTWTESTENWGNTNASNVSNPLHTVVFSYANGEQLSNPHYYSFNITAAVQGWIDGSCNPDKGIILKALTSHESNGEGRYRTLASYNRSSYKPSLSVTYRTESSSMADGLYYLNNKHYGRYLNLNTTTSVNGASGLLSSLGNNIKWRIQYVPGGYVIRSAVDPTLYLGVPNQKDSLLVQITSVNDAVIPDSCIWVLQPASGGGALLYNRYNCRYLRSSAVSVVCTTADYGAVDTDTYDSCVWRIAGTTVYGNTSSHQARELSSFSVQNLITNKNYTKKPAISVTPSNAVWVSVKDFEFTCVSGSTGTVSINPRTNEFTGTSVGISTYQARHKVTGAIYFFKVFVDRLTYVLSTFYGFDNEATLLIRNVYDRVDGAFSQESVQMRAWRVSRLFGGVIYGSETESYTVGYNSYLGELKWNNVAGNSYWEEIDDIFIGKLGYTSNQFTTIKSAVVSNHTGTSCDFAHMQISLASRLAYLLDRDGFASNLYGISSDEEISYLGGWLGDATFSTEGTTVIGNDDYCADLDAENVYRLIAQNYSIVDAMNTYYARLNNSNTRAMVFLEYINYGEIKSLIYYYLVDLEILNMITIWGLAGQNDKVASLTALLSDEAYHQTRIREDYPDTYDFMCSVRDGKSYITDY